MSVDESVLQFGTPGSELIGVLSRPVEPQRLQEIGVVVVVGGPQTRVGSHRQFVLLARAMAAAGYACLRFDYAGMGDSPGPRPDFERAGPDIRRACDAMVAAVPACKRVALWGLCDGASAALLYAAGDERIATVIAANPWARSEATRSAAIVSEHYGSRLRSADFWRRVLGGKVNVFASAREAIGHALRARGKGGAGSKQTGEDLPARLSGALASVRAAVRLQLSGQDLTSAEFEIAMRRTGTTGLLEGGALRLEQADHTFSDPVDWQRVIDDTLAQLRRQ
jgi:exosortase A-associated hydrolase 1